MALTTGFPLPKYLFNVNMTGPESSGEMSFQEVTGLDQEVDFLKYRHGNDKELNIMKRAGLEKSGTFSLKRGVVKDVKDELSKLMKAIFDQQKYQSQATEQDLLTITIKLLDENESTIITWVIEEAVPIKLVGTTLKSDDNAVSIEQIDFVYRRMKIE